MSRRLITLRLEPDLLDWLEKCIGEGNRTALIETLLVAFRDRRLFITSTSAPIQRVEARVVSVCLNPK